MSYIDMYKIISKPWVSTDDIMEIANCGKNQAIEIRCNVEDLVRQSGKRIMRSNKIIVPTKFVLDYLGLDGEYIYQMALKEKELLGK